MKNLIKNLVYWWRGLWPRPTDTLCVLMYHSIADNNPTFFNVTPQNFAKQMSYLADHGYQVVKPTDLIDYLAGRRTLSSKAILITFDDGYEDNYLQAAPILRRYGFPATVFLTTSLIDRVETHRSGWTTNMLTSQEIKQLVDSGLWQFGAHTETHPHLSKLSYDKQQIELEKSKEAVERITGQDCMLVAYPYGDYDEQTLRLAKEIFTLGFTVQPGLVSRSSVPLSLARNSIDREVNFTRFKSIVRRGRIKKKL